LNVLALQDPHAPVPRKFQSLLWGEGEYRYFHELHIGVKGKRGGGFTNELIVSKIRQ